MKNSSEDRLEFYEVCLMCGFGYPALREMAEEINVKTSTIGALVAGAAVHHEDAEKVLFAISQQTGKTWDLNNVKVTVLEEEDIPRE